MIGHRQCRGGRLTGRAGSNRNAQRPIVRVAARVAARALITAGPGDSPWPGNDQASSCWAWFRHETALVAMSAHAAPRAPTVLLATGNPAAPPELNPWPS